MPLDGDGNRSESMEEREQGKKGRRAVARERGMWKRLDEAGWMRPWEGCLIGVE